VPGATLALDNVLALADELTGRGDHPQASRRLPNVTVQSYPGRVKLTALLEAIDALALARPHLARASSLLGADVAEPEPAAPKPKHRPKRRLPAKARAKPRGGARPSRGAKAPDAGDVSGLVEQLLAMHGSVVATAEAAGMSPSGLHRWRSGRPVSAANRAKLEAALACDRDAKPKKRATAPRRKRSDPADWRCPKCGPVGTPLHGEDEAMHCPEPGCDEVVSLPGGPVAAPKRAWRDR